MPNETFNYTVRIVEYKDDQQPRERYIAHSDDVLFMRARGWELIYSTHSLNHTASLYRRGGGLNGVYFMTQEGKIVGTTLD